MIRNLFHRTGLRDKSRSFSQSLFDQIPERLKEIPVKPYDRDPQAKRGRREKGS